MTVSIHDLTRTIFSYHSLGLPGETGRFGRWIGGITFYSYLLFSHVLPRLKIDSASIPGQQEAEKDEHGRPDIVLLSCQNCASLRQRVRELEQQLLMVKQHSSEHDQNISKLEQKISELYQHILEHEQSSSEPEQHSSEHKQHILELEQKISELEQQISELKQRVSELEKKLTEGQ